MNMFGLVGIGDRAGLGMPDAIATIEQTLGGKVDYAVSLEPERTMLCIDMIVKSSDKTRDYLEIMLDYFKSHPVVKNHDIAELLNISDDRARVLLLLLVDNGLLLAKGDRKERTYHLLVTNEPTYLSL